MKITILGAGLAGCTLTHLLQKQGYNVSVIEKDNDIGGMGKTYYKDGLKYEYGPHILYSRNQKVIDFITSIIDVKPTVVYVAAYVEGQLVDYPVSISSIFNLREKKKIIEELYYLNPNAPDRRNFQTYVASLMGKTLYDLFIHGYTKKFWGIDPCELSSSWVPHRISFRTNDRRLFKDDWQAYPEPDYNEFFRCLMGQTEIICNREINSYNVGSLGEDLCISTIPIDQLHAYKLGRLPYRGYRLEVEVLNKRHYWPNNYAWVTFPNDYEYTRICEYKHYNLQQSEKTIISREFPGDKPLHYPINTSENEELFEKYLLLTCQKGNLITMGRLGLYSYLPMSVCIEMCMKLVDRIHLYPNLSIEGRINFHCEIRDLY